jgi:hypothetical protein
MRRRQRRCGGCNDLINVPDLLISSPDEDDRPLRPFCQIFEISILHCPNISPRWLLRSIKGAVPARLDIGAGEDQRAIPVVHAQPDLRDIGAVDDPEQAVVPTSARSKRIGDIDLIALRRRIQSQIGMHGVYDATVLIDHQQGICSGAEVVESGAVRERHVIKGH